jgi:hypothetical protein
MAGAVAQMSPAADANRDLRPAPAVSTPAGEDTPVAAARSVAEG